MKKVEKKKGVPCKADEMWRIIEKTQAFSEKATEHSIKIAGENSNAKKASQNNP